MSFFEKAITKETPLGKSFIQTRPVDIFDPDDGRSTTYSRADHKHKLILENVPYCRVTLALQSLPTGVNQVVTWSSETSDTNSIHDNAVNNSRMTVPVGMNGLWHIGYNIYLDNANEIFATWIEINRAGVAGGTRYGFSQSKNDNANGVECVGHTVLPLNAGDHFEVFAFQNSGVTLNIGAFDEFWAYRIGS